MIKTLTKDDIKLIIELYRKTDKFDEDKILNIESTINDTRIFCATIMDNKITSLIQTNLIRNNYYLEEVIFTRNDIEEVKNLISYTISEIRKDERGLNIIYDNFPYSEIMHQTMLENGFKCNYINLLMHHDPTKIELINPKILLNDKSEDVKKYIFNNYLDEIKSSNKYLGVEAPLPSLESIRLENTNIAVIRDDNNLVVGTARFGLISDSIYLYSLYANDKSYYKELITLISNLTSHNIEVGFTPVRTELVEILSNLGFTKIQTDYILKIS